MSRFQRLSSNHGVRFHNLHPTGTVGKPLHVEDMPPISGNRGNDTRFIRCKQCGFICDKERDRLMPMGSRVGDGVVVSSYPLYNSDISYDAYVMYDGRYIENVTGGCPLCGSYLYA